MSCMFSHIYKYIPSYIYMQSLDTIFAKHNTDKNKFHHNYSRQYDDLFLKYRTKPIKYLEIGVWERRKS